MTNKEYYIQSWEAAESHHCKECGVYLPFFNPAFISHIISKGSHAGLKFHPRNHFILCFNCHQKYEFGDRKSMKIYEEGERIKSELLLGFYSK